MPSPQWEEDQRAMNPQRDSEREVNSAIIAARLESRGAALDGNESPEELVQLLEAVERFERAVSAAGGDLMVNSAQTDEPETPRFVVPERNADESTIAYAERISAAADDLE